MVNSGGKNYRYTQEGSMGIVCGFDTGQVVVYFHKLTGAKQGKRSYLQKIASKHNYPIYPIWREFLTLLGASETMSKKEALALAKLGGK